METYEEEVQAFIEEDDTMKDRYLTFTLAGEVYGIAISFVKEVVGLQVITSMPDTPDYIRGVVNMRGQVIPIMDVRTRFGIDQAEYGSRTCVVVIHVDESPLGLIVDEVNDVMDIPAGQTVPPPVLTKSEKHRFLQGLGKVDEQVTLLLDAEQLLNMDEEASMALCR